MAAEMYLSSRRQTQWFEQGSNLPSPWRLTQETPLHLFRVVNSKHVTSNYQRMIFAVSGKIDTFPKSYV
jgi:hypothetical protein